MKDSRILNRNPYSTGSVSQIAFERTNRVRNNITEKSREATRDRVAMSTLRDKAHLTNKDSHSQSRKSKSVKANRTKAGAGSITTRST